ncbi:MAG TPA: hypothetical protein DCO79_16585 [Spirochaeta sp.]|nr:hypothetical protein [Spirochaeta sp.]
MKKIVFLLIVIALILPASIFADNDVEYEVQATLAMTLSTFGVVFISSMFGAAPDGVTAVTDDESGKSTLKMNAFNPAGFFEQMAESTGATDAPAKDDFPFESMTGSISADNDGNMFIDMTYKGGNVKTMKLETAGEDVIIFTANGKDYSYIDDILNVE